MTEKEGFKFRSAVHSNRHRAGKEPRGRGKRHRLYLQAHTVQQQWQNVEGTNIWEPKILEMLRASNGKGFPPGSMFILNEGPWADGRHIPWLGHFTRHQACTGQVKQCARHTGLPRRTSKGQWQFQKSKGKPLNRPDLTSVHTGVSQTSHLYWDSICKWRRYRSFLGFALEAFVTQMSRLYLSFLFLVKCLSLHCEEFSL